MTFRSFLEDQRARGAERPRNDYFVEWQIPDDDGDIVDLSAEASETEVVLAEEKPVSEPR